MLHFCIPPFVDLATYGKERQTKRPLGPSRFHSKTSPNWSMCDSEKLKWDFQALSNGGHIDQIAFYLLSFSIMNWRYRRQILDPPLYGDNGSWGPRTSFSISISSDGRQLKFIAINSFSPIC